MLDGGGSGGTDWSATDVIDMWLAIANQDTTPHWRVVDGWRKSFELTDEHLRSVRSYRANLIAAWPPQRSAASAAYVARLDQLIEHLQQTFEAASANHGALLDATLALGDARARLEPIVDEYYANDRALAAFATTSQVLTPGHGKTKAPAPQPPVAGGRQEELAGQARSIMNALGRELNASRARLTQPPLYTPPRARDASGHPVGSPYDGPVVPPVVPVDPRSPSSAGAVTSRQAAEDDGPSRPPVGAAGQPGLVLGGVQPPVTQPPVTPPPPIGGGSSGTAPPAGSAPVIPPLFPGQVGGSSAGSRPTVAGSRPVPGGMPGRGVGEGVGGLRAMPPGGVIGGQSGAGLGQPGAEGRPVQRVNPAGGVLQPHAPPARGGTSLHAVGGPQRRDPRRADSEQQRWDPDHPWETAEGVAPVVLPVAEQRVDPGPAIGLD